MIKTIKYNLNNLLLTNEVLNSYILRFWNDIFSPLLLQRPALPLPEGIG